MSEEEATGTCIVCGQRTTNVARVYVAHETRSKGGRLSHSYRKLSRPLCDRCAWKHHARDPIRWLFPIVLQLGWTEVAREGFSFLGGMGLLFAAYGLFKLVANVSELIWHGSHPDRATPTWMSGGETAGDHASLCLKDRLKVKYRNSSERLETLGEYERHRSPEPKRPGQP